MWPAKAVTAKFCSVAVSKPTTGGLGLVKLVSVATLKFCLMSIYSLSIGDAVYSGMYKCDTGNFILYGGLFSR
jgi:hypothetical protein